MSESRDNSVNVSVFSCERTKTFFDLDKKVIVDHLVQVWKEAKINLIILKLFIWNLKNRETMRYNNCHQVVHNQINFRMVLTQ